MHDEVTWSGALTPDRPLILLGCGNMGRALLQSWLNSGLTPDQIFIVDPALKGGLPDLDLSPDRCAAKVPGDLKAGILMLAVKPQILGQAAPGMLSCVDGGTTLLSIIAGKTISTIAELLPGAVGIVRTMPNTPAAIGMGVTAMVAAGKPASDACEALLQAAGKTVWLESEAQIDAVTAVSGSGPAYVFHMIECLAAAGIEQGLPEDIAQTLAIETVAGAGALAATRTADPTTLRENVTSPNGTTQAGLDVLMPKLQSLVLATVAAAKKRAEELSG